MPHSDYTPNNKSLFGLFYEIVFFLACFTQLAVLLENNFRQSRLARKCFSPERDGMLPTCAKCCFLQLYNIALDCVLDQIDSALEVEFLHYVVLVGFDSAHADEQLVGNFLVAVALAP